MLDKDANVSVIANTIAGATDSDALPAKPLLSVVVPAYQAEGSVGRLLDSLCAWNGSDIEIIVVNDGSTDGTHTHVVAYVAHDPRICLIDKENEGRFSACNIGVTAPRGDLVERRRDRATYSESMRLAGFDIDSSMEYLRRILIGE